MGCLSFPGTAANLLNGQAAKWSSRDRPSGSRGLHLLYLLDSASQCFVEHSPEAPKALAYRFRALTEELSTGA